MATISVKDNKAKSQILWEPDCSLKYIKGMENECNDVESDYRGAYGTSQNDQM